MSMTIRFIILVSELENAAVAHVWRLEICLLSSFAPRNWKYPAAQRLAPTPRQRRHVQQQGAEALLRHIAWYWYHIDPYATHGAGAKEPLNCKPVSGTS